MRLIDATNLIADLNRFAPEHYSRSVDLIIEKQPTVDAVPVIRCCDCIHFEYFEDQFTQMTHCDVHDRCTDYTDYCSWAERKGE